ncbi:hypothetical protein E4L95_17615 [Paracoccus liaowanqingii]|uniref:Uncharacterized protein n=1 Tax=Paracoccus liaowanqingii TaxID=2560053 RepID=A0A4Z1C872_9RHOB|nr:hypothetical protein [Paracoccus liaowanqingii]TGN50207.1 hypothetical protein E4L95_17615 [Paracoccus liaowanqingii]
MTAPLPSGLLAALIALGGAAGVLVVAGGAVFPMGGTDLPAAYVLPPLVALALFQLVFGAMSGRWRGPGFWLAALPLTALIWGAGLWLLLDGRITAPQALAGTASALLAVLLVALVLMRRRGDGR